MICFKIQTFDLIVHSNIIFLMVVRKVKEITDFEYSAKGYWNKFYKVFRDNLS